MKKLIYGMVLAGMICAPTLSVAQFKGPSSSTGGAAVTTIRALRGEVDPAGGSGGLLDLGMRIAKADDKKFTIEGQIKEKRGRNLYLFVDGTGRLGAEIHDSQFGGQEVSPETTIRLTGEVDWDDGYLLMEVENLQVVK